MVLSCQKTYTEGLLSFLKSKRKTRKPQDFGVFVGPSEDGMELKAMVATGIYPSHCVTHSAEFFDLQEFESRMLSEQVPFDSTSFWDIAMRQIKFRYVILSPHLSDQDLLCTYNIGRGSSLYLCSTEDIRTAEFLTQMGLFPREGNKGVSVFLKCPALPEEV